MLPGCFGRYGRQQITCCQEEVNEVLGLCSAPMLVSERNFNMLFFVLSVWTNRLKSGWLSTLQFGGIPLEKFHTPGSKWNFAVMVPASQRWTLETKEVSIWSQGILVQNGWRGRYVARLSKIRVPFGAWVVKQINVENLPCHACRRPPLIVKQLCPWLNVNPFGPVADYRVGEVLIAYAKPFGLFELQYRF